MLDNVGGGGVRKKTVRRSSAERAAIVAESPVHDSCDFLANFGPMSEGLFWGGA